MIEILIVTAVLTVGLCALLSLTTSALRASVLNKQFAQAGYLAKEAMEAVRNFRDQTAWDSDGLGTLSIGSSYHPQKTAGKWTLSNGQETVSGFTRDIVFASVQRDGSDNIVESGGVNDPNTKRVTVTVSWQELSRNHQVEIVNYLTNWRQ